jgi:hypothetical protein
MGITFIMIIGLDDCHDALYAHDDHRILGFPAHITFNPYLFNPIFPAVGLF